MADFRQYCGVDFSREFLAHYGVGHDKGGHSGRYPWGSGDRPKQRQGSSGRSTDAKRKTNINSSEKGSVELLAAWAVLTLAGMGVSYVKSTGVIGRTKDKVAEFLTGKNKKVNDRAKEMETAEPDIKKTYDDLLDNGFKPLEHGETDGQCLRNVNPYHMKPEGHHNCWSCGFAYTLRSKFGLNVEALPSKKGATDTQILSCIKSTKESVMDLQRGVGMNFAKELFRGSYKKQVEQEILKKFKSKEGAEGMICMNWKPNLGGGGHAFNWRIENGKVKFIDAQNGGSSFVRSGKFFNDVDPLGRIYAIRLDNAEFDMDQLKKMVKVG